MARVGGDVRHLFGTTRPKLPGRRHDGESTRTAFCRVRRVQYVDVDDEVGRDFGKRKSFLGTADFRNEDGEWAKVEASYVEGNTKYLNED